MPCDDAERSCTAYYRYKESWMTFWFGTTTAEVKQSVRDHPDGDLQQHFPRQMFYDPGNCTCPQGCDRVVISAVFRDGGLRRAHRVIYDYSGSSSVPMIISVVSIEEVESIDCVIRCSAPKASVMRDVPQHAHTASFVRDFMKDTHQEMVAAVAGAERTRE